MCLKIFSRDKLVVWLRGLYWVQLWLKWLCVPEMAQKMPTICWWHNCIVFLSGRQYKNFPVRIALLTSSRWSFKGWLYGKFYPGTRRFNRNLLLWLFVWNCHIWLTWKKVIPRKRDRTCMETGSRFKRDSFYSCNTEKRWFLYIFAIIGICKPITQALNVLKTLLWECFLNKNKTNKKNKNGRGRKYAR